VASQTPPISKYNTGVRAIEIRWQQSDLSLLPADPLASSASSSSSVQSSANSSRTTTTTGETTAPGRSSPSGNSGNSSRLSLGGIAGICIGALVVLILAVGGVILWLRYRKKHLGQTPNTKAPVSHLDGQPVSELGLTPAKELKTQNEAFRRHYPERQELDTERMPPVAVELSG
jgi:hypothetical protein